MQTFVRMTKLHDIVGRSDYISNPDRQECIVVARNYAHWEAYQAFERQHQRSNTPNNEGRELIIALPNEWGSLEQIDITSHMNYIAQNLLPGKYEYQWAVHWNKAHTNLHAHLIFSERTRQTSCDVWDRDIYLTNEGKVARKKADRATDKDGNVKPPVHKKGEPKTQSFSPKDTKFKSKEWLEQAKQTVREYFIRHRVKVDEPNTVPQFHEGKGKEAEKIRNKNTFIRKFNETLKFYDKMGAEFSYSPDVRSNVRQYISHRIETGAKAPFAIQYIDCSVLAHKPVKFPYPIPQDKEFGELYKKACKEADLTMVVHAEGDTMYLTYNKKDSGKLPDVLNKLNRDWYKKLKAEREVLQAAQPTPEPEPQPTPQPPAPESKPLTQADLNKLVALRNDFAKRHCINTYLDSHTRSDKATSAYRHAENAVSEYEQALTHLRAIYDMMQSKNPFKKLKAKSELTEYSETFCDRAMRMCNLLDITSVYDGHSLNKNNITIQHANALYGYTVPAIAELKKEMDMEQDINNKIEQLKAMDCTKESEIESYKELQAACKTVSSPDCQKVICAFEQAKTGVYSFDNEPAFSTGRRGVIDAMKPIINDLYNRKPKVEKKASQTVDNLEKPKKRTYYGRSR